MNEVTSPEYRKMCNAQLCDGDDPSPPPQHCNTATLRSGGQFARLWQQLHRFPHRIAEDDLRGRTSTGLSIDEIELLACQPAEKGARGILRQPPQKLVFLRFPDPFSGSCVSHACIPGNQETRPSLMNIMVPPGRLIAAMQTTDAGGDGDGPAEWLRAESL